MTLRTRSTLRVELLESRIAPAVALVNAKTATFTDVDGDKVIIKVSIGTLTAGLFTTAAVTPGRDQLQLIDLSAGGFDNANLSVSVVKIPGGDGLANVGRINSAAHDLGNVTVAGDLGRIDAGDTNTTTPGIKRLSVRSMGSLGLDTQAAGGSLICDIQGPLGALVVKGDVKHALIYASGVDGTIGSITIGGSIIGGPMGPLGFDGAIFGDGGIGPVKIGGDVHGGTGFNSGTIGTYGKLASVSIGGSLIAGSGEKSGSIFAIGDIGPVKIGHDLRGGSGLESGRIYGDGKLASVSIGGSLIGGSNTGTGQISSGDDMGAARIGGDVRGGSAIGSGSIFSSGKLAGVSIGGSLIGGSNTNTGEISSGGDIGAVKIGGDVRGGSSLESGRIDGGGKLAGVSIGGSLVGGSVDTTGIISSSGDMGRVMIAGSIIGGDANGGDLYDSGTIQGRRIASLNIGGSIVAGGQLGGFRLRCGSVHAAQDIGAITVQGSLIGGLFSPVVITAVGQSAPTASTDLAIKSLTVGGRVEFARIQVGFTKDLSGKNADAQIGAVKVGGDWITSDLFVGVDSGNDGLFGNADDIALAGDYGAGVVKNESPVSKIASIAIGGEVYGTPGSVDATDHHGFVAQQIGSVRVGQRNLALTAGAATDTTELALGITGDVGVREVGL